jgi:hypothetical protein
MQATSKRLNLDREDIFLVEHFLSAAECVDFIAQSEALGYQNAPIATASGQVLAQDIRNNHRAIATHVWTVIYPSGIATSSK